MTSKEGESVAFKDEVKLSDDPTIYVWLTKIESQMQFGLAHQL